MSQRWDDHMAALNALMAQHPRTPYAPPAPVAQPAPIDWAALLGAGNGDMWQGGMNGGQVGGVGGFDAGGKPGDMSNMSPGMLGVLGGGLLGLMAGGPAGAITGAGLGYKGSGFLAGLLGGSGNTGAGMLGNDAKDSPDMMNSGFGDMGGAGGMDTGGANSNAGKEGDAGAMNGFQGGGYTGAGADGVVQPWRRAGFVHEGELVISNPQVQEMVRRMGLLAR